MHGDLPEGSREGLPAAQPALLRPAKPTPGRMALTGTRAFVTHKGRPHGAGPSHGLASGGRPGATARRDSMRDLKPLLEPRSVAIVGASSSPDKSGYTLLKNIVDGGFNGPIYPINPKAKEILGHRAYPTITGVPEPVDLAFIVLPREVVAETIRACQA